MHVLWFLPLAAAYAPLSSFVFVRQNGLKYNTGMRAAAYDWLDEKAGF